MKQKTSAFFTVMAVVNIIVALIPPCAGSVGAYKTMSASDLIVNGKQVGPELDKLIEKEAPMAKIEAFTAAGINTFSSFLLVVGSVGLFMGYSWGRWAAVAGAVIMIIGLFVHDIYQIFFYRPALMAVIDRIAAPVGNLPLNEAERNTRDLVVSALKWSTTMYTLAWSCINPLVIAYLFVMGLCMAFMTGFYTAGTIVDDDGNAAPARDTGGGDEEDDDRPKKRKKKRPRDDDEE